MGGWGGARQSLSEQVRTLKRELVSEGRRQTHNIDLLSRLDGKVVVGMGSEVPEAGSKIVSIFLCVPEDRSQRDRCPSLCRSISVLFSVSLSTSVPSSLSSLASWLIAVVFADFLFILSELSSADYLTAFFVVLSKPHVHLFAYFPGCWGCSLGDGWHPIVDI